MSDKKLPIVEIFTSLEGESKYSNRPTAYVRFGGCNLKCPHFNNHRKSTTQDGYAPLNFEPSDYTRLIDLPLIEVGCDSQYAVNPQFRHLWRDLSVDAMVDELIAVLPHRSWIHPVTQLPVIFSLTGGEPMLRWKAFKDILFHPKMRDCKHVLIETNCTVPVKDELINTISEWLAVDHSRQWTWSNSPKLGASGEVWEDTIKPTVAVAQQRLVEQYPTQVDQYFKFVCDDRQEDYDEVQKAMDAYYASGIRRDAAIWVMPAACTDEQQRTIAQAVATKCIESGWGFSLRVQSILWGNGIGT